MRPKLFVVIRPPIELRHSGRARATGDGRDDELTPRLVS